MLRIRFRPVINFLWLMSICCLSCEDAEDIGGDIEPENANPSFGVYFTDTATVQTATVLTDSIPTSATETLITGRYADARIGSVTASAAVEFGVSETINLEDEANAVYDSLVLVLDYAYYYGDTLQPQTLSVHLLEDELSATETYYNSDSIVYQPVPIGTRTFRPRPNTRKPLQIRLSDELGKIVFERAKTEAFDNEDFKEYVEGITIVPGATDNAAILGFNTVSDSTVIRLYYHNNAQFAQESTVDFKVSESAPRFNRFRADRRGTLLEPLQKVYQSIPVDATNQEAFLQGGTGLQISIELPFLRSFQQLGDFSLNKAELIMHVQHGTYGKNAPLRSSLNLYEANRRNEITGETETAVAYLSDDQITLEKTYRADITEYVRNRMMVETNEQSILILSQSADYLQNSVERVIIGNRDVPDKPVELRVYYTWVQ